MYKNVVYTRTRTHLHTNIHIHTRNIYIYIYIYIRYNAHECYIKEYGKCSAVHQDRIYISDSYTCTNTNCSIRQHISDIDNLVDDICNVCRVCSLETINTYTGSAH